MSAGNSDRDKELSLIFPQWQGYGLSTKLIEGATLIAAQLPGSYLHKTVAVESEENLSTENGILGYTAILRQLDQARSLLLEENPARILTIGGDCGVDVAPISWLNSRYDQSVTVVWLDAHADSNTPSSSPSGHFHGMPLRTLLGEGDPEIVQRCFSILRPDQVVLVGGREFDPAEAAFIDHSGVATVSVAEVLKDGFMAIDRELQKRGADRLYIHLDLDVLDPTEFPYVSYNVPEGFSIETLTELVGDLAKQYRVVGMSVTEFIPDNGKGLDEIKDFIAAGFRPAA
jgi:arginase